MHRGKALVAALGVICLVALTENPVLAAGQTPRGPSNASIVSATRPAHALLAVELNRGDAWVGQAIPITVRATFRAVEGVTLEGAPELKSDAIFTSSLPQQPHQATELVDGEPTLVATWRGTITPSTAGPLALSVTLPVSVRYRNLPVELAPSEPEEDPFDAFNVDPSDPSSINHLFQSFEHSFARGFGEPMGALREETRTLGARARAVEVRALPSAGQPANFSGAVGRFDLRASVSAAGARASEPLTLTVTVKGDADLDRVELAGVPSNADFKTYPMSSKTDSAVPGKRVAEKRFEQVLIPLHGGTLTIPPVELASFDPAAGRYSTFKTAPLSLDVAGAPALPAASSPAAAAPAALAPAEPRSSPASRAATLLSLVRRPTTLALLFAPLLVIVLGAVVVRLRRRRSSERLLRRALRRSAARGSAQAFFAAAQRLITLHFATRWGVSEDAVTPDALRERLGATAEPLAAAISTADALRFGRRELPASALAEVRASIEASIKQSDRAAA